MSSHAAPVRALVNRLHHPVTALGPGRRAGIWLQGCSIGCAGCASRDTWQPEPARAMDVDAILHWVDSLDDVRVHGITITGGEPFEQPTALGALLDGIDRRRAVRDGELDVLGFSGRPLRWLERHRSDLLGRFDAVVAGPYVRSRPTRRIWCGSDNQRITPLTDLGRRRYARFLELEVNRPPVQLTVDDGVWLIGIPRPGDLDRLEHRAAKLGVTLEKPSWLT